MTLNTKWQREVEQKLPKVSSPHETGKQLFRRRRRKGKGEGLEPSGGWRTSPAEAARPPSRLLSCPRGVEAARRPGVDLSPLPAGVCRPSSAGCLWWSPHRTPGNAHYPRASTGHVRTLTPASSDSKTPALQASGSQDTVSDCGTACRADGEGRGGDCPEGGTEDARAAKKAMGGLSLLVVGNDSERGRQVTCGEETL